MSSHGDDYRIKLRELVGFFRGECFDCICHIAFKLSGLPVGCSTAMKNGGLVSLHQSAEQRTHFSSSRA